MVIIFMGKVYNLIQKIASPKYQSISVIPTDKSYSVGDNTKYVKSIKIGLDALGYNVNNDSKQFDTQLESAIKNSNQNMNYQ